MQDNKIIQMMELQQLLLSLSQPQPLLDPHELLLPQPPQKNKRMMIHHVLLPLPNPKPHPLLLHPHPLFDLVLQSLHPQFDKSPIKASKFLIIVYRMGGAWLCFLREVKSLRDISVYKQKI